MTASVRKHIQEAFERARQQSEPAPKVTSYEATIEVVQPIAEPVYDHHKRVEYSSQDVYHIPEPKTESLSQLFDRAVKSLKY